MDSNAQKFEDLDEIRRKLHTARIQYGRLKNKSDASLAALDVAEEKVKRLEKQRDALYTGANGIGRRKKARAEHVEDVKCPICLDDIKNGAASQTKLLPPHIPYASPKLLVGPDQVAEGAVLCVQTA